MRKARKGAVTALLAAVTLAGAAACGTPEITADRLAGSVGPEFRRLFVLQQVQLHGADNTPPPDTWARCGKGGRAAGGSGPGDDWVCLVHWPAPSGITQPIGYEVHVEPNGCYSAQGPATLVGQQRVQGADGRTRTNPLYEFDGCFDTT
ncbi:MULTISPECIES: hypothetical protein [Streptomycetaceae]|uniref:Lipoprotein n=1 Tax=Streptantibioticus cattleyicolor (strain ATCC 35852 / DSM 46488 / JCM 4925 / NBRC 14057 / NRRL 8057) TaxID=1003195 RepID=G8WNV1_STREN|nr:hypothetical protein [Streptantibioticus cattleyicolor]AEW93423.1 hypothetical protein SCATT_10520 [Streptantibioticus cattleyicolor NRRL 8057 = DSM 46488]MYS58136.1 hypothetical protein [Streptomyces sp. SID5468]